MRLNGDRVDLGTIDILRDRERGVPRYNDFREKLRKKRIKRFEDLTDDPQLAEEIRDVYDGDIDRVDLQVGMLAEPLPPGLRLLRHGVPDLHPDGLAAAASRIASSPTTTRPTSTRPRACAWVESNTMVDVLLRHHPELAPALEGVRERVRALASRDARASRARP